MKAIQAVAFGGPEVLQVVDKELERPSEGQVVVEILAAAVTPLDTYLRKGVKVGNYTPSPPYTPGFSFSGVVLEKSGAFTAGQPVYGRAETGSYAQRALCRASDLFRLPAGIENAAAALIDVPYTTGYYSLVDLAQAQGDEWVVVQGAAGSVGAATLQLASYLGMRVIAICSPADHPAAREAGATHALDYREPALAERVRELTDGRGADVIVEVAANKNMGVDLEMAAVGGRIVIVGGTGAAHFDGYPMIAKGLKVLGVDLNTLSARRKAQIHGFIRAGLQNRTLRPSCGHQLPLEKASEAHTLLEAGKIKGGLALLTK